MIFVETSVFTRRLGDALDEGSYRLLQLELAANPERGDLIRGAGGIRKVRWTAPGRGKRGGLRIIYYWAAARDVLLMLFIYAKAEQSDLTYSQRRILRQIVEEEFG